MEREVKGFLDEKASLCVQFRAQRLNDLTFLNNQEIARVMLAVRDYFFGDTDKNEVLKNLNKPERLAFINFLSDIDEYTEEEV